jgi:DNA-binding Lrp family transcriptional regulator
VVSNQPLKPEEFSKANSLREAFNDRKKEVERRMRQESQPELLTQPKLCKAVVDEAYQKLASYKEILKARTQQIREAATKLNEGKTPTPGHWAAAKSEVLSKTPDIPESVWNSLRWSE